MLYKAYVTKDCRLLIKERFAYLPISKEKRKKERKRDTKKERKKERNRGRNK